MPGSAFNWLDRAIASVAPQAAVRRLQARTALAYYEAARPTRNRIVKRDASSGDIHVQRDAATLRAQARFAERNHDLARGIINVMVRNIVGADGISVEPTPRFENDDISDDLARQLLNLWREWNDSPDVTGTRDGGEVQRMLCRAWLRDGDAFSQMLSGPIPGMRYATRIPMALELIESDYCPLDYENDALGIVQGIEFNAWRQPRAFHLYKQHPGDGRALSAALKRVPAEAMTHLRLADRISQVRGVTVLASVLTRLDDLKDYEESERIAARIAASMAAYVKKGQPDQYTPSTNPDGSLAPARLLNIRPGMIFDDLQVGEEIGTISSDRPNSGLVGFRDGQIRAVAAGVDASNSSISRNYNGTYSAQRQELVEQDSSYSAMSSLFVAQHLRPVWRQFVNTVVLAGLVKLPPGIRMETLAQAEFLRPVMPWIDPMKEAEAQKALVRAGFKSATDVIRERRGSMQTTYEKLARERRLADELGLVLDSDARTPTSGPSPTPQNSDNGAVPPPTNPTGA